MKSSILQKILILFSSAGGGHIAISQAISQYLSSEAKKYQINFLDTSVFLISPIYRVVGEYFQDFHQKNWQASNSPKAAKLLHQLQSPIVIPKLTKTVKTFKPNLIIVTNQFPTYALKVTLKNLNLSIPYLIVVADPFSIHHTWTTYQHADHYLVPTSKTKKIFIKRGIISNKISVTGLPLRLSIFNSTLTQTQARKQLNLDPDKLTIFIGGSGEGHGQIYKLTKQLLSHPQTKFRCQLIVVAGKNKLLKKHLNSLAKNYYNLKIFGFTDLIHQLLLASDLIVGKAGPNILFESLMLKKPFIATGKPLSQELGNYHYIVKEKLGLVTHQPTQTIEAIINFIKHPNQLKQFQSGIKKHHQLYKNTPQKTLKIIHQFLKQKSQP